MMDEHFKPKRSPEDWGWYERRLLPHLDAEGFCQFVTFRLYDSMKAGLCARAEDWPFSSARRRAAG